MRKLPSFVAFAAALSAVTASYAASPCNQNSTAGLAILSPSASVIGNFQSSDDIVGCNAGVTLPSATSISLYQSTTTTFLNQRGDPSPLFSPPETDLTKLTNSPALSYQTLLQSSVVSTPAIQAAGFLVDPGNSIDVKSFGVTIGSIGSTPATSALWIGAGPSTFNTGISVDGSKILSNIVDVYGPQKTELFQFGYSPYGGLALSTPAKVSIGTDNYSWLQTETQLLVRSNDSNLMAGVSEGARITGSFYVKTSNNEGTAQTALEFSARGFYLPATHLIIGSVADHDNEMLQTTGRSWFNGDLAVAGTVYLKQEDERPTSQCHSDNGLMAIKAYRGSLYVCSRGSFRPVLLGEPDAQEATAR